MFERSILPTLSVSGVQPAFQSSPRPRGIARWSWLFAVLFVCLLSPFSTFAQTTETYTLDTGDRLRITVFGHQDLSGEFEVSSNGAVSLPLIGDVQAEGRSLKDLEAAVIAKLKPDYLKNPQVSAEVINYRPFFIIGEVKNPGTYPYIGGMRVVNAVALAGGYTYRARKDEILLTRSKGDGTPKKVGQDALVLPGDVIQIQERFF
jgi:polysaccharide export outer membrane protein